MGILKCFITFVSRELVAKQEADLEAVSNGKQLEEYRKLQQEVEKLKGELEHRALKGDFNCSSRVLHYRMNPKAIAEQQAEEKQKSLLREVEELRAQVASGNVGTVGMSSLQSQGLQMFSISQILILNKSHQEFLIKTVFFLFHRNCRVETNSRIKNHTIKRGIQSFFTGVPSSVLPTFCLENR